MSITDSKFPNIYSNIETQKLIEIYSKAPERLNSVIKGLSIKELQACPQPDKWSIQEIVIHLADSEIMGAARIRQTFAEPGSAFAVYDQEIWASVFNYQGFDSKAFYSAIMMFDSLRLNTNKIFNRAKATDWQRAGIHSEWGTLTLRNLLELYADHGERHFGQVVKLRELIGNSIDFPLLLTERLY